MTQSAYWAGVLLVCKVRVGSFGAEAQPASNKAPNARASTNEGRINLFLKISNVFDGGDFPGIVDKVELAFRDGQYYV